MTHMRLTTIRILVVLLAAGLLVILAPLLDDNLRHIRYLSGGGASISGASESYSCRETWLEIMVRRNAGEKLDTSIWQPFLSCGPDYLPVLRVIQSDNDALAELAVKEFPENAQVYLWLGDVTKPKDPAAALEDYQKAANLDPKSALAWCRLGASLEETKRTEEASEAFLNCCHLGDPGKHGCWGAGRVYEKLGDVPAAIRAYRRSTFPPALERADELEKQINP